MNNNFFDFFKYTLIGNCLYDVIKLMSKLSSASELKSFHGQIILYMNEHFILTIDSDKNVKSYNITYNDRGRYKSSFRGFIEKIPVVYIDPEFDIDYQEEFYKGELHKVAFCAHDVIVFKTPELYKNAYLINNETKKNFTRQ